MPPRRPHRAREPRDPRGPLERAERNLNRRVARTLRDADRTLRPMLDSGDGALPVFDRAMRLVFGAFTDALLANLRVAVSEANRQAPIQANTVPVPQSLDPDILEHAGVIRKDVRDKFREVLSQSTARDRRSSLRRTLDRLFERLATTGRQETFREFRATVHRIMQRNPDVFRGWVWIAKLDASTCAVCWAMHGRQFRPATLMYSHINCRCVPLPVLYGDRRDPEPLGTELFDRLSPEAQRTILGPGKHDLYRRGEITLADLVATSTSRRWGRSRHERPLRRLRR